MSRPLNFVHLTTFYPPYSFGGDAMYIYRLAHALGDAGHHIDIIHDVDAYHLLHPGRPPIEFADHPQVTVHSLRSGYGWLSPLLTHQTGWPMLKDRTIQTALDSRPIDVIQYHNISLLGPQVLTMSPEEGRAVKLYMTHEHWLVCPMHVLWKFNQRACEKPACIPCAIQGKRAPQLWRYTGLLNRASEHVDKFVAPSRFTATMHAQRGFGQPVGHLPYFVERSDRDWQTPAPRPQERPYILFVGRLEVIKGLQTVIPLWSQLPEVDLLVAGTGNQVEELRALAVGNPTIKFLGALSQRELAALYFHAVAVIVPSLTFETFGIVIIEAFARKTPVIVRDLGALPEVVRQSQGGLIYQTDAGLVQAIRELVDAPAHRAALGENGYRAFLQWWTKEAHLDIYFELLRSVAIRKFGVVPWEAVSPVRPIGVNRVRPAGAPPLQAAK